MTTNHATIGHCELPEISCYPTINKRIQRPRSHFQGFDRLHCLDTPHCGSTRPYSRVPLRIFIPCVEHQQPQISLGSQYFLFLTSFFIPHHANGATCIENQYFGLISDFHRSTGFNRRMAPQLLWYVGRI